MRVADSVIRNSLDLRETAKQQLVKGEPMDQVGLLVILDAKPGKEKDVEELLKSARPLVMRETGTNTWFALKIGPSKFGIFDTFSDEQGRTAHLQGEVAKALFGRAQELFATPPQIEKVDILATKGCAGNKRT
jgi:quinol monooxygenase YgiN